MGLIHTYGQQSCFNLKPRELVTLYSQKQMSDRLKETETEISKLEARLIELRETRFIQIGSSRDDPELPKALPADPVDPAPVHIVDEAPQDPNGTTV